MHPILKLIVQRVALGILLLFAASVLIFGGTMMLPGDVAQQILGQSATPQALENLRAELGLNEHPVTRYFSWLGGFLSGDLGTALTNGRDIAESLGLHPDRVVLTHMPGSGCYGHNGADDAAYEAALVARAVPGRPILLKWSREDEHGWEPYGTAMATEIAAKLADGRIAQFSAEAIAGTFRGRPRPGPGRSGPGNLLANHLRAKPDGPNTPKPNMNRHGGMHRNLGPIYAFPKQRLVKNLVAQQPHRTSALRCLGAAVNIFAIESFMDEAASGANADPWSFRLRHLDDARSIVVIETLRAFSQGAPTADGCGRGVAFAQYKNQMARVGVAVDVSVSDEAQVRLNRAWIVADAGRVIDRAGLTAQLEGGFMQAASWALHERVTWDADGITSRNWNTYPVLRFSEVPQLDIQILENTDQPSLGCGEAASGPTLAAISNALARATGLRLRRLPFTPDAIRSAALADP